jgi:hypothetical protein
MEMPRILESITFMITYLYKLPIRHAATLDRLTNKVPIDASPYQHFDVLYVMDKFPRLDRDIATHLGKLISRRRQILFYRESHGKNLDTARVQPKIAIPTIPFKSSANPRSEAGSGGQLARSDATSGKFSLR